METRDFLNELAAGTGLNALRASDSLRELDAIESRIERGSQEGEVVLYVLTIENPAGWTDHFGSNMRVGSHVLAFPYLSEDQAARRALTLWRDLSDDCQSMDDGDLKSRLVRAGHVSMTVNGEPVEMELERTSITI